jgi:hypothetical protein
MLPEFLDNQHMKMVTLSDLGTGLPYSQKIPLVLIAVRGRVDPKTIVWPEGISK